MPVSRDKRPSAGVGKRSSENERRRQLVQIAFDQIASKGFEGLRFHEVAEQAGINNATLYYYFPSKEALIQGVVDFLMERLKAPTSGSEPPAGNAVEELRQVFEGTRRRVAADPAFFIVITELGLPARRDRAIDRIGEQRDDFWARRLAGVVARGVAEGLCRADIDQERTVAALMVQIKGIAHHAAMGKRKAGEVNGIVSEIAAQVEHWLTCGTPRPRREAAAGSGAGAKGR